MEHTINDALAALLRTTRNAWRDSEVVRSENTGMLKGTNGRPDILVIEPNVSPVAIETEIHPAATLEGDVKSRLGAVLRTNGRQILSVVSVRYPVEISKKQGAALAKELAATDKLEMALYTGSSATEFTRWPNGGWILGTYADLSVLAQSASLPPQIIENAANQLVIGVSEAAGMMAEIAQSHPGAIQKISEELKQHDDEQTRRMGATILANAFVFHGSLAGGPDELKNISSMEELRDDEGGLAKSAVIAEWRKILDINYWPIFDIALRILKVIPAAHSKALIERMAETAEKLLENRLMHSHDLTGAVFQKLIADRKFLAAYYTTPPSAALLVGLAVSPERPPAKGSWKAVDDVTSLRIADFACGTGTLLSAAYQRIGQLHELSGGDAERIHPMMMGGALVGCDVLPAAAHLTASMLSGAHPTVQYTRSGIFTFAYGKQPTNEIRLGSLDLLDEQGRVELVEITAKSLGGSGAKDQETWWSLRHASFDLVIMNPPFTRATGHEAKKVGVPNPMFAAFSSSKEEQKQMAAATQKLTKGTSVHGNAGEASIFLVLGHRKLKADGQLALVMPLSLLLGEAWEASRSLLMKNYSDLILVTIAGAGDEDSSFSADTGIGECLVVGRKRRPAANRATFVVLRERPTSSVLGASIARQILQAVSKTDLRRLEDGPVGGTAFNFGNSPVGSAIDAPLPDAGTWNLACIVDLALAQTAFQLENGVIWLPSMDRGQAVAVPISKVSDICESIGPYHSDIDGSDAKGGVRGPFNITDAQAGSVSTYPALWSHNAKEQASMAFAADSEATPKPGSSKAVQEVIDEKVKRIWSYASHCHFNRDFRFNSQPTGMQFTPRRSLGGRAWIAIRLETVEQEKALVLWANTSLGLLLHWWHANKQQSGRGSIGVSALDSFPVLDVSKLNAAQLAAAVKISDDMCGQPMLPLHELDTDPVRRDIDERFSSSPW